MKKAYKANYDDELESSSEDSTGATALLPKSVLQGKECQVGDTITLKVTAIRDGEVQVSPAGGGAEPEEPEEPTAPEDDGAEETTPEETAPAEGAYD